MISHSLPVARSAPWFSTVGECLRYTAQVAPDNGILAYTRKGEAQRVPYCELLRLSEAFARYLVGEGVEPGTLVGLVIPSSVEFFVAFFGCQLARVTAVTLSLPVRVGSSRDRGARRLRQTIEGSGVEVLLDGFDLDPAALGASGPRVIRLSEVATESGRGGPLPRPQGDDLGLVQFTSGSLSRPKGVCLTQQSISFNIQAIVDAVGMNRADTIDLWIPLYHDMGLMGSLTAVASQGNLRLCSPLHFLVDPLGWLLRFAGNRSTINPSPHFFFRMLSEAYDRERAGGLDLSSWRVAFNGAEPIQADDLERFFELYGPHGFRETTMYPVYGLAESTLAALFPRYGSAPRVVHGGDVFEAPAYRAKRFVSVGRPIAGHEAKIDPCSGDEAQLALPPGIGELKIRGPSVTRGYLGRRRETQRLLSSDGWLSTQDLAFRHQGEYFICGRIKEMIIVRGENYFPEDFEALVDRVRPTVSIRITGRAAFPYTTGEEEVVAVAVELKRPIAEEDRALFLRRFTAASQELCGVAPAVFFLEPRSIPRTTSGKLQRLLLAQRLESGEIVPRACSGVAEL